MNAVEWLLEIPRRYQDREFLLDSLSGRNLTFGQLHQSALAVAADLRARGLKPGDRVVILLHNSSAFVRLYYGCLYAGLVTVPVNPVFSPSEVNYIIESSRCALLVASAETHGQLGQLALQAPVLLLDDGRSAPSTPPDLWNLESLPAAPDFVPLQSSTPEDTMTIVFTSGTTSSPTGVIHRIADLVDNARLFNQRLGIGPENRFYGILAMTYLGGYYNLLMLPYVAGSSVVLSNVFDARTALDFWGPARAHGVNTLWLVPTILAILMELDRGPQGPEYCKESVRLGLVGTAPLAPAARKDFEEKYGVPLYENYGLSETLFITTNSPSTPVLDGSVGPLLPGVQVSIVDGEGKALDYGQEGEVMVCTPYLMEGVLEAGSGACLAIPRHSWHASGDLGVLAPTGELYITGRKKDLIIRGGVNISPAAIENVIQGHPAVLECAVVGMPHAMYGEEVAVVVRLLQEHSLETVRPELVALCRKSLGTVRQPAHVVEIEEFPRSSSGKIRKRDVRTLVAQQLGLSLAQAPALPAATKLPPRVRQTIVRPDADLVARLGAFSTSLISDCLNRLGCMDGSLRPLGAHKRCCGPAVTVEETEGGNLMSHLALELAQPGDVLVVDAKGCRTRSCWGGLQSVMAGQRGLSGVVLHGSVRDGDEIQSASLAVFGNGYSPAGPLKGWAGAINFPIACAGAVVTPGDVVVGDEDGLVVVPRELLGELLPLCEARRQLEASWSERVDLGESTLDAVGLRPLLKSLGVEFI